MKPLKEPPIHPVLADLFLRRIAARDEERPKEKRKAAPAMPRYRVRKPGVVNALRIKGVFRESDGADFNSKVTLTFDDSRYEAAEGLETAGTPFPQPGWYYVVYPDGHHSFNPAQQFDADYVLYRRQRPFMKPGTPSPG